MRTHHNTLDSLSRWTLFALYELAAANQNVSPGALARTLGTSPAEVRRILVQLETRGLVWAERCALTLPGLAHAARIAGRNRVRRCAA